MLNMFKSDKSRFATSWFLIFLLAGNLAVFAVNVGNTMANRQQASTTPTQKKIILSGNLDMNLNQMQDGDVRWMQPSEIAVDESQYVWANPKAPTKRQPKAPNFIVKVTWTTNDNYSIYVPKDVVWKAKNLHARANDDDAEDVSRYARWQHIENVLELTEPLPDGVKIRPSY